MPLETASYVGNLVPSNPPGTDPRSQGDDHLRLLKSVLQATFPGMVGAFARVQAKATPFTPALNDNTSLFVVTAGSAVSMSSAATYGNGYCVSIMASGTAVVVTPNGVQTINGLASLTIPAGQVATLWSDGSALFATLTPTTAAWTAANDGAGSGLDADLLDGQQGAFYQDASNINAGTLNAARLAASGVAAATYGTASQVAQITVDVAGRVTSAVDVAIQIAESQVTNLVSDLAARQPLDATLTAVAGAATGANTFIYFTAADVAAVATVTPFARSILDDADAATVLATIGAQPFDATLLSIGALGGVADQFAYTTGVDTWAAATVTSFARTLLDDTTQGAAQATLGLVPGTNVQAFDATLNALAAANWSANAIPIGTGADTLSQVSFAANTFPARSSSGDIAAKSITDFGLSLVDDVDASTARSTLGLVIGTNVQAFDAELAALAGLTSAADALPYFTGSGTAAVTTLSSFMRTVLDDTTADAAAATLSVLPLSGGTLTGALTLSADGSSPLHAVTKQQLDAIGSGVQVKTQCRVATTANGALATAYENGDTVDGVVLATGDRILLKDQTTQTENGIYTVNASGAPTRATDMDTGSEALGALTFVTSGTANTGKQFYMNAPGPITLGSTNITWVLYYQPANYIGGAGMTLSGLTFDVGTASSARIVVNADNIDLATTAVGVGSYGSTTQVGTFTVDAYGRLTTAANATIDLSSRQPLDATLTALAALTIAADSLSIGTGADAFTQTTFGVNTFPAKASTGSLAAKTITDFGLSLVDDANASAARTTLGLVIGTDVQAFDATLSALAGADWSADSLPIGTGVNTVGQVTFAANTFPAKSSAGALVAKSITDFALTILDDANAGAVRTTISAAASGANTDLTSIFLDNTGLKVKDTDASHGLTIIPGSNLSVDRTFTIVTGDASRTLTLSADLNVSATATISGTNTGDQTITLTGDVTGSGTGSFAATIANNSVTAAKLADMATNTIRARVTAGTGDPEDVAIAANQFLARSSTGQLAAKSITDFGLSLIDDADASAARTTLGLVIGTNVQAYDATLNSIAALGTAADKMIYTTALDTWAEANITSFGRSLVDDADATAGRATLGVVIGTDVQAYDVDTAKLDVNQSWTKAQGVNRSALTFATTVAVDASLSNVFTLAMTGAATLGQPTNPKDGQGITIFITQDATGGRTLAYHADWLFVGGGTDPVLSTAANAVDVLTAVYNGATSKWYGSLLKGFA